MADRGGRGRSHMRRDEDYTNVPRRPAEPGARPGQPPLPPGPPPRSESPRPGPSNPPGAEGGAGRGGDRGRGRGRREEEVIHTRPSKTFNKTGTMGQPLNIVSNYFQLVKRPDMKLLQYRVDYEPDIEHIGVKKALVKVHENVFGKYIFDGTLLYCVNTLAQPLELFSNRISDGTAIRLTFRLVGEVQKEDATYVTVMNIIVRRCLSMLKLVMIKRNYFDPQDAQNIASQNLNIWPGYLTSIRHHEDHFLLGVEVIHKVMRCDTAFDVIDGIRRNCRDPGAIVPNMRAELEGKIVMTHYNHKTYRIDDIDMEKTPSSTFHLRKEDRDVSYMEYYRTRYNVTIRNPTQPLLVSRPTRRDLNRGDAGPIYLIPELCGMTGLSDADRKNFGLMKDVANVTRVNPDRRVASLMRFRRRIQDDEGIQRELRGWGFQFANELIKCKGRQIERECMIVQDQTYLPQSGDWSNQTRNRQMAVSVQLRDWIVFHPRNMGENTMNFVKEMKNVGRSQNFMIPEPKYVPMNQDQAFHYIRTIEDECQRNPYSIAFVVLRTNKADTYNSVKKITCCDLGIPSQVVTGKCLNPGARMKSIATKVMVQIASKMGAEPWRVTIPQPAAGRRWMVVGYDTYHDAKQRKAVGAFIASTNPSFTRYVSSVMIHENNEDISPSFNSHLHRCVKAYYCANKDFPTDIFVYRDGVGAGDIARVKELEMEALRTACRDISKIVQRDFNPGIAFTIVSKRISTRLFADTGRSVTNPPCGTIVDNTVTQFERFDFFLVSQKANQGTVSPTSFNVIEDTTQFTTVDMHQKLAYALTHLYYNWAGTLRVPAPVQYAHKLAYLIGEANLTQPSDAIATLPYYL